ncbi:MAG TPA: carboxypeptidase-like regulatory domain-containing protein, partial [Armatimonadota bacterium]|nr:carboxypeptidase-like regulatory domain-containing protein [Armatimonadota bacterium]
DGPTASMNIVIGPWDELGDIEGTVTNPSNQSLSGARVIAIARYPQDRPADEASVISKVAIADRNGRYVIDNLPASITVNGVKEEILYDVIASFAGMSGDPRGYDNELKTATVAGGYVTSVHFKLESSTDVTPEVPVGWTDPDAIYAVSYTVPKVITSRAENDAYDAIKSCISEKSRKVIALKKKSGRAAPAGSIIENNVVWYSIWHDYFGIDPPVNHAGFTIYRGTTPQLQQNDRFRIDFLRDPAIISYSDTSDILTAGVTYWYGVSSVTTSYLDEYDRFNPEAESDMTYPTSVTPLGKLTAVSPANNAQISSSRPTFSWNPVSGARSYKVYIYEKYPIMDAMFTPEGDPARPDHLPSWAGSQSISGTSVAFGEPDIQLVPGRTYWWVVIASNDSDFDYGNAFSISALHSFVAR